MAELKQILSVDTTQSVDNIKNLREEVNGLKAALEKLEIGSEAYNATQDKLIKEQSRLNDVMAGTKGRSSEAQDSYYALNKQLVELRQSYRRLSEEDRNGIVGASTLKGIQDLDAKLKALDADMGQHFRNVGNYSGGIMDAFQKMGISFGAAGDSVVKSATSITNAFMGMGKGAEQSGGMVAGLWKTLSANPIGIVIAALGGLVAAFAAVTRAVQDNEESQNRLHIAMSAFQPMKDQMTRWLDSMGVAFTVMASDIGEAVRQTREMIAAWKDWMGLTTGEADRVRQENENYKKIAEGEVALQKLCRKNRIENSKDTATIQRLREEAAETKDVTEKTQKLTEAKELQTKVNQRNTSEAKLNLAILKAKAATTPNSIKVNDELAEAEAKVNETEAAGSSAMRGLTRELNRYEKAAGSAKKSTDDFTESIQKEIDALVAAAEKENDKIMAAEAAQLDKAVQMQQAEVDKRKTDLELEEEQYQEKLKLFEQYGLDTYELTLNHEERVEELRRQQRIKEEEEYELHKKKMEEDDAEAEKKYEKLMKARQTATKNMVSGTSAILKNLSVAMGENTKLGKGFAIAAATIDAIASAVAGFRAGMNQWADAGPMAWMAPVQAAINATMALTAGFAQVQKIRSVDTSGSDSGGGGMATALAMPNIEGLSSPVDYTRQVTTETEQEEMNKNSRVYILESDIQESGNRVKIRENETTF